MGAEELFDIAAGLCSAAACAYAGALAGYLARALAPSRLPERLALAVAVAGAALHSVALGLRWWARFLLEVALPRGGEALDLAARALVFAAHPPWASLYGALDFGAFALVAGWLLVEARLRLPGLGPAALALALLALVEAALVSGHSLAPLLPALQGGWVLLRAAALLGACAVFTLAALLALLHLVKCGVHSATLVCAQAAAAALLIALIGGAALLGNGRLELAVSYRHEVRSPLFAGRLLTVESPAHVLSDDGARALPLYATVPAAGVYLLGALALLTVAAVLSMRATVSREPDVGDDAPGARALLFAFSVFSFALGLVAVALLRGAEQPLAAGARLVPGEQGPFHFRIDGDQSLVLLAVVWVTMLLALLLARFAPRLAAALPEARRLDEATFFAALAGWLLLTAGIGAGPGWPQGSWSRLWSGEPRESWAILSWFAWSGYLLARLAPGWSGKRRATLAVAAFVVLVLTFTGANLSLDRDGLYPSASAAALRPHASALSVRDDPGPERRGLVASELAPSAGLR